MRNHRSSPVFIRFLSLLFVSFAALDVLVAQLPVVLQNGQPAGSDIGLFEDTPFRRKIDLAGTWSYTLDGEQWHEVRIPAAFDYTGKITFLRRFSISDSLLERCAFSLVAFGVNYEAEVYINDIFIGKHAGGSTSFQFDIPEDVIQSGDENAVTVVVSNVLTSRTTLPVRKQVWGWKTYGGILRDMFIVATPRLWVQTLAARPSVSADARSGLIEVRTTISNRNFPALTRPDTTHRTTAREQYQLLLQLFDKERGNLFTQAAPLVLALEDGKDAEVSAVFPVTFPRLWSPEAPVLYRLSALLVRSEGRSQTILDEHRVDIGFATVGIQGADIRLNGKKVTLRGVTWYEDDPEFGAAISYDRMEKDVALIKALGANAVRFAFHPPHPYMLTLCNRYGLLALVELPIWNVPAEVLADDMFLGLAEQLAREMVLRDMNHPSVVAWGLGSDFDSADPRARASVERIASVIRGLDPRPVYYGSSMPAADTCVDLVDLAAICMNGEDQASLKEQLAAWKQKNSNKPVVVVRYGKTVESGNRNGYSDPLSEEAQARYFLQTFGTIRDAGVAGSFIQALADWRGDRPLLTVRQEDPYLHPVGLMNRERQKRLAYDVVKTLFAGQKVAALPIGKHRSTFPLWHVIAGFAVIFAVAYQYHYNRRFNESFKRSLFRSYNFFVDLRDVRTVSVFHTLLLAFMISLTLAVVLSGLLYHFRQDRIADYLLTQILVWDSVKEAVVSATWNPAEGILTFTGVFLALSVLLSIFVRIGSFFVRTRIQWLHTYTTVVWASVPLVFLSPVGMSLFKILQTPFYVLPVFLLLALFAFWILVRTLKGTSVLLDLNAAKTYIGGAVVLGAIGALIVLYYDSEFQLTAYLDFLYNLTRGSG